MYPCLSQPGKSRAVVHRGLSSLQTMGKQVADGDHQCCSGHAAARLTTRVQTMTDKPSRIPEMCSCKTWLSHLSTANKPVGPRLTSWVSSIFRANLGSKNLMSCSKVTPGSPGLLLLTWGAFAPFETCWKSPSSVNATGWFRCRSYQARS